MRVGVVSPWYPDRYSPYSGVFVRKQVEAVEALGAVVDVEHPEIFPAPAGPVPDEIWEAMRQLASKDPTAVFDTNGQVVEIPSPVPSRSGFLGRAESFANTIAIKREFLPLNVDIFHAHLGIPTGLALLELGDRPLVVTEHQSTLERMLAEPGAVDRYRDVVQQASTFICVSGHLRDRVLAVCGGDLADRIEIVPNIVDLTDISFRMRARPATTNWIYVGGIAQHKGVELLLKSFDLYRKDDPDAHLTIVGEGPHRPWVERFASGHGFRNALVLTGALPHTEVGGHLDQADVMVHLSTSETFGIASLEAIGAGLPVVSLRNGGVEDALGELESEVGVLLDAQSDEHDVVGAVHAVGAGGDRLKPEMARSWVEDRYSAASVGSTLMSIYRSAM